MKDSPLLLKLLTKVKVYLLHIKKEFQMFFQEQGSLLPFDPHRKLKTCQAGDRLKDQVLAIIWQQKYL